MVNDCIGQFIQKFFIQFCGYSHTASFEVLIIELYYGQYKSHGLFKGKLEIFFVIIHIFNIIFLLFSSIMLRDQWGIIQNDSTLIDMKKKI